MGSRKSCPQKSLPIPPDKHPGLHRPVDKIEMYGWEMVDRPGRFAWIGKGELNVDHDYQRDNVKHHRVNRIAARWSWVRLGSLLVAERPDGSFWVFDGQHRKLAADKRSDITRLPCMVYRSTGPADESKLFVDVNQDRGPVQMIDRFKALLAQNDPTALKVEKLVGETGYRVARGTADRTVCCVGAIYAAVAQDADAAGVAWRVACEIHDGKQVVDRVFRGLYAAERHVRKSELGSLVDPRFASAVARLTPAAIYRSVVQTAEYWNKSGPKIEGEAVVRLLNKGRGRNPIPSLYGSEADDAA